MSQHPHPWAEYARLQAQMSRTYKIDSHSWGSEEEMNLLLDDPSEYVAAAPRRAQRLRDSVARRERSHARARKLYVADLVPPLADPVADMEAREKLVILESQLTAKQWTVAISVAQGLSYAEISLKHAMSIGAARAQMCRLREQFRYLRAAA